MTRLTRWVAVFDSHGDKIHAATYQALREFVAEFEPDIRIAGGDHFDFRWLRGKASDQEQREDVQADLDAGREFLCWLKPTHVCWGNHDDRAFKAMKSDVGPMRDLARRVFEEYMEASVAGAVCKPYDKRHGVIRIGELAFVQGYGSGINTVRQHAMTYGNVVMGHIHRAETVSIDRLDPVVGRSSGCLCELDLDYNKGSMGTLRQSNGWVYGVMDEHGRHVVWHAQRLGDRWILPSEMMPSGDSSTSRLKAGRSAQQRSVCKSLRTVADSGGRGRPRNSRSS